MSSSSHPLSIFREYITKLDYFPTQIINRRTQEFDFILGFARETMTGTGQFHPTSDLTNLSPQRVTELKETYPYVRVVISIGGVGSKFNPQPNIDWVTTAVSSIKAIIQQYNNQIDGIDIHYDAVKSPYFVSHMGEVINRLKNDPEPIKVVSIAPTKKVHDNYRILYAENSDNIDWVDYRFYNQQFNDVDEFTSFYDEVVLPAYPAGKVLAGISNRQDPIIFDGIKHLIQNKSMPGAFVWNADESVAAHVPFSREKELQNL